jgi:hypothetical protein
MRRMALDGSLSQSIGLIRGQVEYGEVASTSRCPPAVSTVRLKVVVRCARSWRCRRGKERGGYGGSGDFRDGRATRRRLLWLLLSSHSHSSLSSDNKRERMTINSWKADKNRKNHYYGCCLFNRRRFEACRRMSDWALVICDAI